MTENEAKEILLQIAYDGEYPIGSSEAFSIAIQALEEIQQYRSIGTIEEIKALKEKSVPRKIKGIRFKEAICPNCETELFETYWAFGGIHYCSNCGQTIDWQ